MKDDEARTKDRTPERGEVEDWTSPPSDVAASTSSMRCAFCHDRLEAVEAPSCTGCGTHLHAACWKEAGGGRCTTIGCSTRDEALPRVSRTAPPPITLPPAPRPSRAGRAARVVGGLALAIGGLVWGVSSIGQAAHQEEVEPRATEEPSRHWSAADFARWKAADAKRRARATLQERYDAALARGDHDGARQILREWEASPETEGLDAARRRFPQGG